MKEYWLTSAPLSLSFTQGHIVASSPAFAHRLPSVFSEPNSYQPERFRSPREEVGHMLPRRKASWFTGSLPAASCGDAILRMAEVVPGQESALLSQRSGVRWRNMLTHTL